MKYLNHEAHVDEGWMSVSVANDTRHVSCFVMALPKPRKHFVRFSYARGRSAFCKRHDEAFSHLGGIPRRIWYASSSLALATEHDRFMAQRSLQTYAFRRGFEARFAHPHQPSWPGRAERILRRVSRIATSRHWTSLEELNRGIRAYLLSGKTGVAASRGGSPQAAVGERRQAHG